MNEVHVRRPRWWLRILIAVVCLGALIGAAELVLRWVIPDIVTQQVRDQLHLTDDHPVEVTLGGSAVVSAIGGRVGQIDIQVPNVQVFDGIVTTLEASAESMPFDPTTGDIVGAQARVTIPAESVGPVVALVTQGLADSGEVRRGQLEVGRTVSLFGAEVTLAVVLDISVSDGEVWIEPTEVNAAGFDLTAEHIRNLAGDSVDSLITAHELCVRDKLPAGVTLDELVLSSTGSVILTAELAPGILSDQSQQEPGTCTGASGELRLD